MAIQRMDNVLIVVDDLEAAKAFFVELGPLSAVLRPRPRGVIIALAEQLS